VPINELSVEFFAKIEPNYGELSAQRWAEHCSARTACLEASAQWKIDNGQLTICC
jgi:hypothetical protein